MCIRFSELTLPRAAAKTQTSWYDAVLPKQPCITTSLRPPHIVVLGKQRIRYVVHQNLQFYYLLTSLQVRSASLQQWNRNKKLYKGTYLKALYLRVKRLPGYNHIFMPTASTTWKSALVLFWIWICKHTSLVSVLRMRRCLTQLRCLLEYCRVCTLSASHPCSKSLPPSAVIRLSLSSWRYGRNSFTAIDCATPYAPKQCLY